MGKHLLEPGQGREPEAEQYKLQYQSRVWIHLPIHLNSKVCQITVETVGLTSTHSTGNNTLIGTGVANSEMHSAGSRGTNWTPLCWLLSVTVLCWFGDLFQIMLFSKFHLILSENSWWGWASEGVTWAPSEEVQVCCWCPSWLRAIQSMRLTGRWRHCCG